MSRGPYIGGVGESASYAITSTDGEIAAISGGGWTDTEQKSGVSLAPGASETYERVFVVGERPYSASLVSELTKSAAGDVGAVEIALVDASGQPRAVGSRRKGLRWHGCGPRDHDVRRDGGGRCLRR